MKKKSNRAVPFPLILVFVLAVLLPSVALCLLALRAAEREAVYVERRIEGTLLAETDLVSTRIEELLADIHAKLANETPTLSPEWQQNFPIAGVVFHLNDGEMTLYGASSQQNKIFFRDFGAFLQEGERLQIYDSIARVYRKEMVDEPLPKSSVSSVLGERREEDVLLAQTETTPQREQSLSPQAAPAEETEDFSVQADALAQAQKPSGKPAENKPAPPIGGKEMQRNAVRMKESPAARDAAFSQASREGFQISKRIIIQRAPASAVAPPQDERSGTVSRGQTLDELLVYTDNALLPKLSDDGLQILFWSRQRDGSTVGCLLDMNELRDRIVAILPDILSDIRVLTVLDESANPIIEPGGDYVQDWRRPFVAREISPLLPRWEIAAWLTDTDIMVSRTEFARYAVWMLVAILFLVIASGSGAVIWMLNAEIRTARQRTTFVANVSHELKTPLTSIRLFAELLLSGKQTDDERRRDYLRIMMSETDRLAHLVDNVLTFSRRGRSSDNLQRILLCELTETTLAQLEPHLAKHGFAISFEAGETLCVTGNRESLKQVVMNLISNAEKYSDATRELSVVCRREYREKDGKTYAVVDVADRGIGVEPQFAEKIFQEFFRSDDSLSAMRSGTGLGLPIARDIAKKHGGNVTYAPREGGGSVFTLRIPLAEEEGGGDGNE